MATNPRLNIKDVYVSTSQGPVRDDSDKLRESKKREQEIIQRRRNQQKSK